MSPQPSPPRTPLITPAKAVQAARLVVGELRKSPLWQPALTEASAVTSPLLVRRLDLADSYYYVVSFLVDSRLSARVLIDGLSAGLVEIGGVDQTGRRLAKWVSTEQAIRIVIENPDAWAPDSAGAAVTPVALRREAMSVQPVMGWKSCTQSRSRFLPFYLVMAATRLSFVRADGECFPELTHDTIG